MIVGTVTTTYDTARHRLSSDSPQESEPLVSFKIFSCFVTVGYFHIKKSTTITATTASRLTDECGRCSHRWAIIFTNWNDCGWL